MSQPEPSAAEAAAYAASKIAEYAAYAVLLIVPLMLWIGTP
jgi:hypothetical protein